MGKNVPKVGILITDGRPMSPKDTKKEGKKMKKVARLVFVGLGKDAPKRLAKKMASKPAKENAITVEDMSKALNFVDRIADAACPEKRATTTTTTTRCDTKLDVILMLDSSGSLKTEGWKHVQNFAAAI